MSEEIEQEQETEQEQVTEPTAPALFEEDVEESEEHSGEELEASPEGSEHEESETLHGRPAPNWAREAVKAKKSLAKEKFRLERENAELRAKLAPPEPTLTPKPTLDQYDYDETRFSEAYDTWMEQKAALDAADRRKLDAQRQEQETLENFKKSYADRSKSLGVDDFQEAEQEVGSTLSQTQSGLIMRGTDDPAAFVYALGKSPSRLLDLAKITDPVKFTVAVARMELQLATKKTNRPKPEERISSERTSSGFNAGNATLEKLRARALVTGDYTEVSKYKRDNKIS